MRLWKYIYQKIPREKVTPKVSLGDIVGLAMPLESDLSKGNYLLKNIMGVSI